MKNFKTIAESAQIKNSRPTIGVIKSNRVDYRESLQTEGLKFAAKKNDVNLIIFSGGMINSPDELSSTAIYDFVNTDKLDGLIIWTGNINWYSSFEKTESFIRKYDYLPVISLEFEMDGVTSILCDDYNGMREAMIHLLVVHKYRRIAFIRGLHAHIGVELRYKAYLDTLTEYGIPIDESIIFDQAVLFDDEEGARKLERVLIQGIDAIVAYNDLNARRVYKLIERKKAPIVSIVGFDDDVQGKAITPALTTVHPPFYEMGIRAVDSMLAKINGLQVPDTELLTCDLVVRQTCGCSFSTVKKEDLYKEKVYLQKKQTTFTDVIVFEFEKIVQSIVDIPKDIDNDCIGKLLTTFLEDVQGEQKEGFISYLEKFLIQNGEQSIGSDVFQDLILVLYFFTDPFFSNDRQSYLKAQKLMRQAINLITEIFIRIETNKRLQQNSRDFDLISFSHEISNTFDMKELVERMIKSLKDFGISSSYLSIFENTKTSTDKARLILAYNEEGPIDISPENSVFPSVQLVPEGINLYDKRHVFIIKSLYFQKKRIGFVLFEDTLKYMSEYEELIGIISTAINGVMLIEDLANKTLELTETNIELKSAYKSLKENQQKLLISEKIASLGRLTAGIALEMSTPLAAVQTSLEKFNELIVEYIKSAESPQVLPEVHRLIAENMKKFIKLAQLEANKSSGFIKGIKAQTININTSNLQSFNAAKVISDSLVILDLVLKQEKCNLITSFDNLINLYGDSNKLVQVINNLVINAIDACKPEGGNILLSLQDNKDGFAQITVQDTGCGIPDEILSRIFEPLFSTKPFGEGTGLGLSIVHDIVHEFKGSINVESKKGMTSFIISLPIKQEEF